MAERQNAVAPLKQQVCCSGNRVYASNAMSILIAKEVIGLKAETVFKYITLALMVLLIGALSFLTGMYVGRDEASANAQQTQQAAVIEPGTTATGAPETPSGSESSAQAVSAQTVNVVGPNVRVSWETVYASCTHSVVTEDAAAAYIGLTREELAARYPGCEVAELTSDKLVLRRRVSGYCADHLILKRDEKGLVVIKTDPITGEQQQLLHINFDLSLLDAEVLEQLDKGLLFETLEQIDSYLEGIES